MSVIIKCSKKIIPGVSHECYGFDYTEKHAGRAGLAKGWWSCNGDKRGGDYAAGLIKDAGPIGHLGEIVFGEAIGLEVNSGYIRGGTPWDFKLGDTYIDIKTARRCSGVSHCMVVNEEGVRMKLSCDHYICAYCDRQQRQIIVVGVMDRNDVQKLSEVDSRGGEVKNKDIPWGDTYDAWKLINPILHIKGICWDFSR